MSQSFPTFNEAAGGDDVRTGLLNERSRTDTLRSNFSGTSFPSTPVIGQHCYRTDQGIEYVCTATTPSAAWAEVRTGTVPLTKGGTGATDAAGARASLGLSTGATSTVGPGGSEIPNNTYLDGKFLAKTSNLVDLPDKAAARTNLGLGSAAQYNASAFATAAQGAKADTALQPGDVSSGIEIVRTVYTAGATWTKPVNLLYIDVEAVGGGGGGGAGTGSSSVGATGGSGGTSSFGAHCSATGGSGGLGGGATSRSATGRGGGPGVGVSGNVNSHGGYGATGGCSNNNSGGSTGVGGSGGASYFGSGGRGAPSNSSGSAAAAYGSGGGGYNSGSHTEGNPQGGGGGGSGGYVRKLIAAASLGTTETITVGSAGSGGATSGFNGYAGAAGVVIVTEYRSV